jgi:Ca2+/Na+ antiporter
MGNLAILPLVVADNPTDGVAFWSAPFSKQIRQTNQKIRMPTIIFLAMLVGWGVCALLAHLDSRFTFLQCLMCFFSLPVTIYCLRVRSQFFAQCDLLRSQIFVAQAKTLEKLKRVFLRVAQNILGIFALDQSQLLITSNLMSQITDFEFCQISDNYRLIWQNSIVPNAPSY